MRAWDDVQRYDFPATITHNAKGPHLPERSCNDARDAFRGFDKIMSSASDVGAGLATMIARDCL